MKLSKISSAIALATAFGASAAYALPVSSAVPAGPVQFSDNSAEYLIDNVGNNGKLDVGDSLRGIFSIDNITGSGPQVAIGTGTVYNELTGLYQIIVTSKTALGNGNYNFTFGFDPSFGKGAGVLGVMYDDPAQNFARANCGGANNFAACEATATGGSVWATIGLGANGFWTATNAPDDPSIGGNLPLTTPIGVFSMGVDFITNNTGYQWNQVKCVDTASLTVHTTTICGQGGLIATGRNVGGADTPYDLFDNVDFTANRVPEPTTLALLGLGFLGLGFNRRQKR